MDPGKAFSQFVLAVVVLILSGHALADKALPIVLKDTDGYQVRVAEYQGKITLVHFWATWCLPCKKELPLLISFTTKYRERGVRLILIAADSHDAVKDYINLNQLDHLILVDQYGSALRQFKVKGIPHTSVVNQSGEIVSTMRTAHDWQSDKTRDWIERLILSEQKKIEK